MYPEDLKYTSEHEWVRSPGEAEGSVRVGITDYAQEALGDIVYVSLPEVGVELENGTAVGELESTKSVSDVYAPLGGTVSARNAVFTPIPFTVVNLLKKRLSSARTNPMSVGSAPPRETSPAR